MYIHIYSSYFHPFDFIHYYYYNTTWNCSAQTSYYLYIYIASPYQLGALKLIVFTHVFEALLALSVERKYITTESPAEKKNLSLYVCSFICWYRWQFDKIKLYSGLVKIQYHEHNISFFIFFAFLCFIDAIIHCRTMAAFKK